MGLQDNRGAFLSLQVPSSGASFTDVYPPSLWGVPEPSLSHMHLQRPCCPRSGLVKGYLSARWLCRVSVTFPCPSSLLPPGNQPELCE